MSYFACQFKEQGGYKMSTLKIIPEESVHTSKPLQWRMTDIKQNEFEGINAMWSKKCKPQSNWTIEKWMTSLNRCIKEYRKQQTTKKSQLGNEIKVITPMKVIYPINSVPMKVIHPINSVPMKVIEPNEAISKNRDGCIYDLVTDESNPIKQINDTIKEDIKEFIIKRLNELQAEHGLNLECSIDFNLELYFD